MGLVSHRYCNRFSSHLTAAANKQTNNQSINQNLTSYRKTSSLLGNKYLGCSTHLTAIMPPRRGRGGRSGGTPAAPDPSPRAQRTPGPVRASTAYGSPAQLAPSRAAVQSSYDGMGNAIRSVQEHNPDAQRGRANQRNRGSVAPPANPPASPPPNPPPNPPVASPGLPPQPVRPPPGPAANNRGMLLVFSLLL